MGHFDLLYNWNDWDRWGLLVLFGDMLAISYINIFATGNLALLPWTRIQSYSEDHYDRAQSLDYPDVVPRSYGIEVVLVQYVHPEVQRLLFFFKRLHILLEFLEAHHLTRKPQGKVTVTPVRVTETSRPEWQSSPVYWLGSLLLLWLPTQGSSKVEDWWVTDCVYKLE